MESFLNLMQKYWLGVLMILLSLSIILWIITVLIKFLARTFNWGRYKQAGQGKTTANVDKIVGNVYFIGDSSEKDFINVIVDFFAKIIADFRSFLALLIIAIFFFAVAYALLYSSPNFDDKLKALQAVVATLGGIVGSIIGYYFGESAARTKGKDDIQNDGNSNDEPTIK